MSMRVTRHAQHPNVRTSLMCYFSSTDQIISLIHHLQILFPMNLHNHRVFFKYMLVGRGVKGPRAHDLRTVAIFGEY